jgi:hypothetical protein
MALKLCIDCEFLGPNLNGNGPVCEHPSTTKVCVVTGSKLYYSCKTERGLYSNCFCRPEARLFKRKEVQGSYGGEC